MWTCRVFAQTVTYMYSIYGKTFTVFHSIANLFLQNMALSIGNISLQKCYSESFTMKSHFPIKTQKFPPTDVLLYAHIWLKVNIYRQLIFIHSIKYFTKVLDKWYFRKSQFPLIIWWFFFNRHFRISMALYTIRVLWSITIIILLNDLMFPWSIA